jgi:hypothetical protein
VVQHRGGASEESKVRFDALPLQPDIPLPPQRLARREQRICIERAQDPEEATPQREVDLFDRLVDEVHRPDHEQVLGQAQRHRLAVFVARREVDDLVPILEKREALAEHPTEVGAVDLVEDQDVGQTHFGLRVFDLLHELRQVPRAVLGRTALGDVQPANEVLVAVGWVELKPVDVMLHGGFDGALLAEIARRPHPLERCSPDDAFREPLRAVRLPGPRRPVEDHLPLVTDDVEGSELRARLRRVVPSRLQRGPVEVELLARQQLLELASHGQQVLVTVLRR